MVKVTDFKNFTKDGREKIGYYMDGYLRKNLDGIPNFLEKEWDVVGIVTGHGLVGTGKTVTKDTKVKIIEEGKIKESKSLGSYKDGDILDTLSLDFKTNKIVYSKSQVIIEKDIKEFYEVKLSNGNIIKCSLDHYLFIKRKNKIIELPLRLIKEGDELVCQ